MYGNVFFLNSFEKEQCFFLSNRLDVLQRSIYLTGRLRFKIINWSKLVISWCKLVDKQQTMYKLVKSA